jgi:L-malate glycosyltransferase
MNTYNNTIKIIYYLPQLTIGGTEKHLLDLTTHLNKDRYLPAVWCPGPWGNIGDELLKNNIEVVTFKIPFQLLNFFLYLKRNNFDIFHSYGYGTHYIDTVIAKLSGIPIYISSRRNMRHWEGGEKLHISERIRNYFSDIVIANSEAVKFKSIHTEKLPSEKITTIHNGISLPETKPSLTNIQLRKELGIPENSIVIGNIANLKAVKGQRYLLEAFAKLARQINNINLVLVGEGPDKDNLLVTANLSGIKHRVHITNSYTSIFDFLNMFDIFVLPSLSEGFSNALLEAMAMGKPVITSDVGGMSELVTNHETGLIVKPADSNELAEAILALLDNPKLCQILAVNAKRKARNSFSLQTMINHFETVYEDLMVNKNYAECKTQRI